MRPPVVVSRCDRLGDLVLSLPSLGHLARSGCDARVLHCARYAADVGHWALFNGLATNLWIAGDPPPDFVRGASGLSLFHSSMTVEAFRAAKLSFTLGPRSRLSAIWSYSVSLPQHRSRVRQSEMRYNLDLAEEFLLRCRRRGDLISPAQTFQPLPALRVPPEWSSEYGGMTGSWDCLLVLSNGGSASNLPTKFYLDLARERLEQGQRVAALVSGLDADKRRSELKASGLVDQGLTLVPELPSVKALIVLLSQSREVIASSTGPLHMAHAAGVAVRGLYPSRPLQETFARWRPDGFAHGAPVRYQVFDPSL